MPRWFRGRPEQPVPSRTKRRTTRERTVRSSLLRLAVRSFLGYLAIRQRSGHWKRTSRTSLQRANRLDSLVATIRRELADEKRERERLQDLLDTSKMIVDELTAAQEANIQREQMRAATYSAKRSILDRPIRTDEEYD